MKITFTKLDAEFMIKAFKTQMNRYKWLDKQGSRCYQMEIDEYFDLIEKIKEELYETSDND